jgi:hypothetical protein
MCSFIGFESVRSVIIPNCVKTIGQSAFALCFNLQKVTLGDGVESIGNYTFECCHALQTIDLSRGLISIGDFAFYHCRELVDLAIPDEVTSIGNGAFAECENLKTFSLGKSLESIGANAFYQDNALIRMTCMAQTPPTMPSITTQMQNVTVLNVPIKSLELYRNTLPWKWMNHIVGVIDADVNGDDEINIADVNMVINAIIENDNSDFLDVNGDGEIGIADINAIIDAILGE